MAKAYVALGTNMGKRTANLQKAVESISRLPQTKVVSVSSLYETKPWGYSEQNNFLNAVALVETELGPFTLLGSLLGIEAAMGRVRTIPNGPRIIDLDLLMYDKVTVKTPDLTLPHPRMMERGFVLKPLTDLLPEEPYLSALSEQDQTEVWLYEE